MSTTDRSILILGILIRTTGSEGDSGTVVGVLWLSTVVVMGVDSPSKVVVMGVDWLSNVVVMEVDCPVNNVNKDVTCSPKVEVMGTD